MKELTNTIACEINNNKIAGANELRQLYYFFELHDLMNISKTRTTDKGKKKMATLLMLQLQYDLSYDILSRRG